MKIIHINLSGPYDVGWGYQENLISKYHKLAGNEVLMITTNLITEKETGNFIRTNIKEEYDNDVKVIRLNDMLPHFINYYLRLYSGLYALLNKENPDFIFVHGLQSLSSLTLCKYLKKHNIPCCVDNHADFSNSGRSKLSLFIHKHLWKYMAQKLNKYTDVFFGVLPARCDFLENVYSLPKEKIDLLIMGADDQKIPSKHIIEETRNELKISKSDVMIISGGKIDESKKEVLILMKLINQLKLSNIKLVIFGSVVDSLKNEFNSLIGDSVYLGWKNQDEIYKYLCSADIAIYNGRHSVLWEQTVGCGIPCVFKDWDNTHHIDIGSNCLFIKGDDEDELKDILLNISKDQSYLSKLKTAASNSLKDKFLYSNIAKTSIEITTKRHGNVY